MVVVSHGQNQPNNGKASLSASYIASDLKDRKLPTVGSFATTPDLRLSRRFRERVTL